MTDPLKPTDAAELAEQIAALARAELPLADGLRAAAAEATNRRQSAVLRQLADRLEGGQTLDDAVAAADSQFPEHVGHLVRAGIRTGRLGHVLTEYLRTQSAIRELWSELRLAMAYPMILLSLAFILLLFFEFFVVPDLVDFMVQFDTELPDITSIMLWISEDGVFLLAGMAIGALAVAGALRLILGAALWWRLIGTLPLLGTMAHWSGVAEMSRTLALLVEQEVPLPEALRLASGSLLDPNMRDACRLFSERVSAGERLADAMQASCRVPLSMVPFIRFGEQVGTLPDALQSMAEMFETRIRMRAELIKSVMPQFTFVVIGLVSLHLIVGLFAPLMSIMRMVTYLGF